MSEPQTSSAQPLGAPVRQRPWVILACIAKVVGNNELLPGTDVLLEYEDPPSTTMLTVPDRIAPDPKNKRSFPYVVDVHSSGRFLLYTIDGGLFKSVYHICDAHTGVATRLPACTVARISPRRSIGFIEDPGRRGHYMVAQLHPTSSKHHATIAYYCTGASGWAVKKLGSSPYHESWGNHGGVIAHDGKLWWVDLPYGLLTCDPFVDRPDLIYVALPEGRVMANANHPGCRKDLDKHRCVKVSEGKLRYVEIHGAPGMKKVSMWTLTDPEGPDGAVWEHEYEVLFEQIWTDESYIAAGLPPNKLPAIGLIHPKNHGVLYFFHGTRLFAMNMYETEKRVLECGNSSMDYPMLDEFSNARFVHAWELPPTLFRLDPSTAEMKMPSKEELSLGADIFERYRMMQTYELARMSCTSKQEICAICFISDNRNIKRKASDIGLHYHRAHKGHFPCLQCEARFVSKEHVQVHARVAHQKEEMMRASAEGDFTLGNLARLMGDMQASAEGSKASPSWPSVDASDQDSHEE